MMHHSVWRGAARSVALLLAASAVAGCGGVPSPVPTSDETVAAATPSHSPATGISPTQLATSTRPPTPSPMPHGAFTATGPMLAVQDGHTATLLEDGPVLIAGGNDETTAGLTSAELFDPKTGVFSIAGSMAVGREYQTATLLPDGQVLMAGGDPNGSRVAELYDPATGSFRSTGSMVHDRLNGTGTLLPDGAVLVVGGAGWGPSLASAELYDPSTGKFSSTGSMKTAREQQTATLLRDGRVLIAGGDYGMTDPQAPAGVFASAEIYDPTSGKFSATGSMHVARSEAAAVLLPDGRVFIAGGLDADMTALASTEIYDPSSGKFSPGPNMIFAGRNPMAALLRDGRVLVAGGYEDGVQDMTSAEIYDPVTNAFTSTGPMAGVRAADTSTATALNDGRVLFAGEAGDVPCELYWP